MRCGYCGEEITAKDSNYGLSDIHCNCALILQDEMANLGMIEIVSRTGNIVAWKLTGAFEKLLYKTLDEVYSHILHDLTVEDSIIDMLGVVRAVGAYIPDSTPPKKTWFFAGFIFNGMMRERHGVALPADKMFHSRAKEFLEKITPIPISKEEAERFKTMFGELSSASQRKDKASDRHGMLVAIPEVNMELDAKLDRASQQVLDTIEEIALKMEAKLGASTTWRGFRMDEILLQTIRDMITDHLQTFPTEFETSLTDENQRKLTSSLRSMLMSVVEVVSSVSKQHDIPFDVVFARFIHNTVANLVVAYAKMKLDYAKSHGLP